MDITWASLKGVPTPVAQVQASVHFPTNGNYTMRTFIAVVLMLCCVTASSADSTNKSKGSEKTDALNPVAAYIAMIERVKERKLLKSLENVVMEVANHRAALEDMIRSAHLSNADTTYGLMIKADLDSAEALASSLWKLTVLVNGVINETDQNLVIGSALLEATLLNERVDVYVKRINGLSTSIKNPALISEVQASRDSLNKLKQFVSEEFL